MLAAIAVLPDQHDMLACNVQRLLVTILGMAQKENSSVYIVIHGYLRKKTG